MAARFAEWEELERVNELREQVNDLHVAGRPETFKPGFPPELRDFVYTIFRDPRKKIVVCEREGEIRGFAVLNHITLPETPLKLPQDFLDVDELGVDAACRRQGVGSELMEFIRDYARGEGFDRIELNKWEFNREALEFYEALGFAAYRRYMELKL